MSSSRELDHNFHDGCVYEFRLGPRRELALVVGLDPVWNPGGGRIVIRFGGIENFDEVSEFFRKIERPNEQDAAIDQVDRMKCDTSLVSKGLRRFTLELDHNGAVEIDCRTVTIS